MTTNMYMVHTCPKRVWYVNKYLLPSLFSQGIEESQVILWYDILNTGNLRSCLDSFASLNFEGNTWHLQDDIVISKDFVVRTNYTDYGDNVVCGMYTGLDEEKGLPSGEVMPRDMWYSFQCIRIPNDYARDFSTWFRVNITNSKNPDDEEYRMFAKTNKFDATFFKIYMETVHPHDVVINLSPNIVDHIDWLIGGSIVDRNLLSQRRALYFKDSDVVDELQRKLSVKNPFSKLYEQFSNKSLKNGVNYVDKQYTISNQLYGYFKRAKEPDTHNRT